MGPAAYTFILLTVAAVFIQTEATENRFNLTDVKRTTSSITVSWDVPLDVKVKSANVYAVREGSQVTIQGIHLSEEVTAYELTDLVTDAKYNVCLSVHHEDASVETHCLPLKTIALVRPDSVYVLFIVIGVLVGLCVLGCVCWYIDKRKLQKGDEDSEQKDESPTEDQKTPILAASAPTSYERPKSGLEDDDIPYITPPKHELERERLRQQQQGRSVVV